MLSLLTTLVAGALLAGLGVQENKQAPSPSTIMRYAPAEFDYMIYVDFEALLPHSYEAFLKLKDDHRFEGTKVAAPMADAIRDAEITRNAIRMTTGFDPVSDVKSVALFAKLGGDAQEIILVVRGAFAPDAIEPIARQVPPPLGLVLAADGSILAGTLETVKARATEAWRPKVPPPGSAAARAEQFLERRPFVVLFSHPSPEARDLAEREIGPTRNALYDLATGHTFAALRLLHDGIGWTWQARTEDGYRRAVRTSEGLIEVMRGSQKLTRGLATLLFISLESYRDHPALARILEHREDLMTLLFAFTGDGRFRARIDRRAARRTVTVSATAGSLGEVLPAAALAPVFGALAFALLRPAAAPPAEEAARETEPPGALAPAAPGRLEVRERYRQLRDRYPDLRRAAEP